MAADVERYDAVIVGGSFGGLAAASQLDGAGRVLLADREAPGVGETSASGTLLAVLERLDALDALEQVHPTLTINVAGRRISFQPAYPFATFDYRTLCEILVARLHDVEVAVAPFRGVEEDGTLLLGDRRVQAPVRIDASGWRAALARALGAPPPDDAHLTAGLEARHGHGGCDLEFWIRPEDQPDGVFWAFPAGGHVREGVASYRRQTKGLREHLGRFIDQPRFPARTVHGGMFPSRLRDPVWGDVFLVGDAAGQCLPLTGEGIRPALVWGQEAGRWARRVLDGGIGLGEALGGYRGAVLRHARHYRRLERLQAGLLRLPLRTLPWAVRAFANGPVSRAAQHIYWALADPARLDVAPGVRSDASFDADQCATGPAAGAEHLVVPSAHPGSGQPEHATSANGEDSPSWAPRIA